MDLLTIISNTLGELIAPTTAALNRTPIVGLE